MAKRLLDPYEKQESQLASWCARLHARMLGVRRGPEADIGSLWMRLHFLTPVHETVQHVSCEHVPSIGTQNGWSLRTTRRHAHRCPNAPLSRSQLVRQQQQNWELNGDKWSGVHPARVACWRWEHDFELSCGTMRDEAESATSVGWKATAQSRPEWKALEQR